MDGKTLARRVAEGAAVFAIATGTVACSSGDKQPQPIVIYVNGAPASGALPSLPEGFSLPTAGPIATATEAPTSAEVCQAKFQLGPWAPDSDGTFHNPEVDGTQPGTLVVAEMWGPWAPSDTEIWVDMLHQDGTPVRAQFNRSGGTG